MVLGSLARPRRLGGALVAAGVLAVAGCSGSGQGDAPPPTSAAPVTTVTSTPSPTETAEPSPTETSTLPPLPDAAKENTPEGAEAFIRYYFDVVNKLHMDPPEMGQIELLVGDELVDPDCVSCGVLRDELQEFASGGYRTLGPIYTVQAMSQLGGGPPGVQRFNMTMLLEEHVIEETSSGETFERESREVMGVGAAIWDGERWLTYDMELG